MSDYWKARTRLAYYAHVKHLLRVESTMQRRRLIDVGSYDTPMVLTGNYDERFSVDVTMPFVHPSVTSFCGDWLNFPYQPAPDTVVTCLQVLEHLPDDILRPFVAKLFEHATRALIISVPWQWPVGRCSSHLQDPIDFHKLHSMVGRLPTSHTIISEPTSKSGAERLVAYYLPQSQPCD